MKDHYGRTIDYLRVSITDRCNLRCRYCMPHGIEWVPMEEILTLEEITEVCRQASALGIRKIKITGGEPLVRKGCIDLIGMLTSLPGIEQVTLTTNGILLKEYAADLKRQGLHAVNVSLDTLNPDTYTKITGASELSRVLEGIRTMEALHIPLKINVVLQQNVNAGEWKDLVLLAKDHPLDVRFIELMPIGYGKELSPISNSELLKKLTFTFGSLIPEERPHGNGPARYYRIEGFQGSIGFISAIHLILLSTSEISFGSSSESSPRKVHPAAFICPPPPNITATRLTLTSPFALKLTLYSLSESSYINTAAFTPFVILS